ncbi:LuxR C-terminal-related transcriptional regulator [uncultured Croceitalea sp.]|uniref:helix-turn-helix transcriptional regulator n=1 Tax=uncultured Croceitalea sp. TaxID=1798908 RepID=UPI0033064C99
MTKYFKIRKHFFAIPLLFLVFQSAIAQDESVSKKAKIIDSLLYYNEYSKALPLSIDFLNEAKTRKNDSLLFKALNYLGYSYYGKGFLKLAQDNFLAGYDLATKNNNEAQLFESTWFLSVTKKKNEEFTKAIAYNKQAQALANKLERPRQAAQLLSNRATLYKKVNILDSALLTNNIAAQKLLILNDSSSYWSVLINKVEIFNAMKLVDSAKLVSKRIAVVEDELLNYQLYEFNINKINTLILDKRPNAALKILNVAQPSEKTIFNSATYYDLLSKIYALLNDDKGYNMAISKVNNYKDSIQSKKNKIALDEMNTIVSLSKAENELVSKNTQLAILEIERENKNIWFGMLILGLVTAGITILLLYKNHKTAIKNKELELNMITSKKADLAVKLEMKNRELSDKLLASLKRKEKVETYLANKNDKELSSEILKIFDGKEEWQRFRDQFQEVHPSFFRKLNTDFPELTSRELNVLALVYMRLTSKDIASISGISLEAVEKSRYRIRKKMNISKGESLYKELIKTISG